MSQKSVYLAGPEVFFANARDILDIKIELTRAAGLIPVSPGDLEFPKTDSAWDLGLAISRIDEQLMNSADAIIANSATWARRERRLSRILTTGLTMASAPAAPTSSTVPA